MKRKLFRVGTIAYKRLGKKWRKARGLNSKVRVREKSRVKLPTVGYRSKKESRYLHPSGMKETLIHNLNDLQKIDSKKEAIKISSTIGEKKKKEIIKKTEELKIKVLNP